MEIFENVCLVESVEILGSPVDLNELFKQNKLIKYLWSSYSHHLLSYIFKNKRPSPDDMNYPRT
jgi:hypothetical protein